MSPGGLALLAPGIGNVGDRVIAYLDNIGRVEGKITRIIDNGFAMTIAATARKRDKLAAQLTWLANRDILNLPEDRRHDRIVPRNPTAILTLEDGSKMTCRIIDMSLSGAAIAAETRPPLRSLVMLGRVQGAWCETSRKALASSSSMSRWQRLVFKICSDDIWRKGGRLNDPCIGGVYSIVVLESCIRIKTDPVSSAMTEPPFLGFECVFICPIGTACSRQSIRKGSYKEEIAASVTQEKPCLPLGCAS
jgi:hypothetical protein